MTRTASRRAGSPDVLTLGLYLVMIAIGWLMIFSASHSPDQEVTLDFATPYGRQLAFIAVGLVLTAACLLMPYSFWRTFAPVLYLLGLGLLLGVLFFGSEVKGAKSWFNFAGIGLQPSEYAKLGVALVLASYTSSPSFKIDTARSVLTCLGLIGLPMLLILLQPDAGSALVFTSVFFLFYRLGLWPGFYVIFFAVLGIVIGTVALGALATFSAVLAVILVVALISEDRWRSSLTPILIALIIAIMWILGYLFTTPLYLCYAFGTMAVVYCIRRLLARSLRSVMIIALTSMITLALAYSTDFFMNQVLEPHQSERIYVWLQPSKCDPRGSLYNVIQSKVAIGSGGWSGKGYGEGTMTKLNYVPEQQTDFIFCTVGEEFGFVGVILFILLYAGLIMRMMYLAEQSRKVFTRNYGYIIVGYLLTHFLINIGMTMGLMPIIGIPLPFVSYGGSSLIFFTMMVAIFIRLRMDDR